MIRKTLVALAVSAGVVAGTMGVASAAVSPTSIDVTATGQAATLTGLTPSTTYDIEQCYQTPSTLPSGTPFVNTTYCTNTLFADSDPSGTFNSPSNWGLLLGRLSSSTRSSFHTIECAPTLQFSGDQLFTTCFLRVIPKGDTTEGDAQYVTLNYPTSSAVPETPYAIILPIAGVGVLGIGFLIVRNRRRAIPA